MTKPYNLKNVRTLLIEGFTDKELRRFCFYEPDFRSVHDDLAEGSGKAEIVDHLLEHAERKVLLDKLLAWAKENNLAHYEEYQPYKLAQDTASNSIGVTQLNVRKGSVTPDQRGAQTRVESEMGNASSSNSESQSAEMPKPSPSASLYALVMKGGGIKGLAYVGALEELGNHYTFNWFVGTSAGAIAAVLLAAGYSVSELKTILYQKDFRDFLDAKWYEWPWNLVSQGGIHPAYEFTNWIEKLLAEKLDSPVQVKLKDLKYRVTIYASRRDEDALIFDSHDPKTQDTPAAHAVRCSMSIPFIFTPQMRDGMRVLDGGMRHNYPVGALLNGQLNQNFVGLYLGPEIYEGQAKPPSLIGDLLSIWTEAPDVKALREYGNKTVIIDPRPIGTIDFALADEEKNFLVDAGRAAARKFLLKQDKLTNKAEIDLTYEKVKHVRNGISQKRRIQHRNRIVVGIVVALVIGLIIAGLTLGIPDITGGNNATSLPTPIQTGEAIGTVSPTSTLSLVTSIPSPETGISPSPPTTNYSGNLAIPLISGLGSKVYLTGFDGEGINGPNPVSLDAQQPMFSHDGKSLMVKATLDGVSGLYKLTASGFDPEITITRGSGEWPVLSPDGGTMMFSETTLGSRLQVRKSDGTIEELPLKNEASLSVKNLLWSEDNQLIFQGCATLPNQPDSCGIWITNVSNLEPKLIVENKDAYPMSARSGSLAYMSREDGDWEIYLMPLAGGAAVKLTDNNFEDGLPAISPDGNAVAYISNESGAWGVWTVNLDGQNKKFWFDINPGSGVFNTDQWSTERMSWRR